MTRGEHWFNKTTFHYPPFGTDQVLEHFGFCSTEPGLAVGALFLTHSAQLKGKHNPLNTIHSMKDTASIDYGIHREYEEGRTSITTFETIGKLEHLKVLFCVKCGILRLDGDFYLRVGRDNHIHGVFDLGF